MTGASLHARVSRVMLGLTSSLLLLLVLAWSVGTRHSISEEIEAASRVTVHFLEGMAESLQGPAVPDVLSDIVPLLRPLGRIRANELAVYDASGRLLYRSPPPVYKAGRAAPEWFVGLIAPELAVRSLLLGQQTLVIRPDPSRAVLDAWDELLAFAGWGVTLLLALFAATRAALGRALRPLEQVLQALDRTGSGRFDTRLPLCGTWEIDRLARAFNGMADRLHVAVDDNVRLETERELAKGLHQRLAAERQDIARELHDELAQGITAVRALAGAIARQGERAPGVEAPARSIIAVTGGMQDGIRHILHRLHAPAGPQALQQFLDLWRERHPAIALQVDIDPATQGLSDPVWHGLLRIVQEGLTNVLRHAQASQVVLRLSSRSGEWQLALIDNGCGRSGQPSAQAGCGLGLAGMAERVTALGGELSLLTPAAGGFGLLARFPLHDEVMT
ncbi:MAG: histidine kinase [Dechloromonas sp.]|nr:histidine kinase [Dechloromonas sp.]